MSAVLIRKFLLKLPRPHTVRYKVGEELQLMTIPPNPHWAEIAESLDNLTPELLELLDSKGGLIRSAKAEQVDDQLVEDRQAASRQAQGRIAFDAETERFKLVATLLGEAYKWGNEVAWGKLVALFETVVQIGETKEKTISGLQKLIEKVYAENAALAVEAGVDQDPMTQLMGLFLAGQQQGQAERMQNDPQFRAAVAAAAAAGAAAAKKPTNGASNKPRAKA